MPPEWLGQFLVVNLDVLFNGRLQFTHAGENTPIERAALQLTKPPFDGIQPRRARRRKMQLEPRVLGQPGFDLRSLVSRTVIQDHMQIHLLRSLPLDLSREIQKLLGPVTLGNAAHHLARQNIEGRVQTGRAMALVIVCMTLNLPRSEL